MTLEKINPKDFEWQVILNPYALSSQCILYKEHIDFELKKMSIPVRFHVAEQKNGTTREVAHRLCLEGKTHFVIVGGDGTINEIINGIFESGIDTTKLYVAILPFGTGNDFCRTHLYPRNFTMALQRFAEPTFIKHDVGLVKTIQENQNITQRYFINIAGFGFDAAIIDNVSPEKPAHFAAAVYLQNLLKVLFRHKSQFIHLQGDNINIKDDIFSIAVGIGKYNGNGMMQVPIAIQNDGLLDVVVIRKISPLKVIFNVKKLYSGSHLHLKEVSVHQTTSLSINSMEHVLGEVEGEMLQQGRYDISILPNIINIMTMRTDL